MAPDAWALASGPLPCCEVPAAVLPAGHRGVIWTGEPYLRHPGLGPICAACAGALGEPVPVGVELRSLACRWRLLRTWHGWPPCRRSPEPAEP